LCSRRIYESLPKCCWRICRRACPDPTPAPACGRSGGESPAVAVMGSTRLCRWSAFRSALASGRSSSLPGPLVPPVGGWSLPHDQSA
jgi:hypothetical protein